MANINFVDGSSSVPGQADAKRDQKNPHSDVFGSAEDEAQDGAGKAEQEAMSLFGGGKEPDDPFGPNYGHQRIRFHKADEVNPYADAEDERLGFDPRFKQVMLLVVALVASFVLVSIVPTNVFSITVHPSGISAAEFLNEVKAHLAGLLSFVTGQETIFTDYMWEIIAAILAGAAMGLSGGVYQGALKNALASPSTLGVTSGGTLGLIFYAFFVYGKGYDYSSASYIDVVNNMTTSQWLADTFGMFLCSFFGCVAVVLVIMLIAYLAGRGHVSNVSLIIAGQVFAAVVGVIVEVLEYYLIYVVGNETLAELVMNASSVTFNGVYNAVTVAVFGLPLVVCFIVIFALSGRLSLLAFNDDEARSMGISTTLTRNVMVGVCTVMTALVISFTGPIGFVGFMVPHIARRIIGPEFRYLLPATALLGAILVAVVHCVSYLGLPWFNVGSTGIFTSIVGCIFFLIVALRSRGDKRAEWY